MIDEVIQLKQVADEAKILYNTGKITKEEAQIMINPYIEFVNNKSKELAKKYNQKYKSVTFSGYVR